ncbi:ThuA domain-containing protein [Mucilaginibacter sp. KACC 22063]|uniref:ThuA domain-containing protein n=1 Tax=Mucilaginibacter sp. KACC 22063 TaxID=3025666 RepID=UPI00236531BF|nr:ThuA domain-containing protein [Mucilaginibacter sp. KACC 22063]WDF57103.1 ThuA domain-containing protein [Mucilaginibacter sp. KACC 22063]
MNRLNQPYKFLFILSFCILTALNVYAQKSKFHVIAFYTAKNDQAHISFVHEANKWFPEVAKKYHFTYDSTNNWNNLNPEFLKKYKVIIFLDTRPEEPAQRKAFENYVKNGGGWMGFHFSAFALNQSTYNQDWDWYHNEFLGSGEYKSNTWRPTSAFLRIEDPKHAATKGLNHIIKASPNEWYRWQNDLIKNKNIDILLAIDSSSFPLGTGPKQSEIWHNGYYPVVWSNKNYRMVYFNMGHNDIDYEHGINKDLSHTFDSPEESQLVINTLLWLGNGNKTYKAAY